VGRHWHRLFKLMIAILVPAAHANMTLAEPGLEIVPIAVWQGKPARPWSVDLVESLREALPQQKIAHAVSAARLIGPSDGQLEFRFRIARVLRPGDDVLLHFAPWKTIVEKAGFTMKFAPTLFGAPMVPDDCRLDCGLELGVSAFSGSEIRSMVQVSTESLAERGFGAVRAIYFDQGIVTPSERSAAMVSGISEDWSGVDMGQLTTNLGRFPVWQWNDQQVKDLNISEPGVTRRDHLRLDHVRFGIHAEIADMESSEGIINKAIVTAKNENRVVRLPIVFNVEDLIHTHRFVSDAMTRANQLATAAGITSQSWTAQNQTWDVTKIKPQVSAIAAAPGEAEFLSSEEIKVMQENIEASSNIAPVSDTVESEKTAH
jgi:hypothetical protein